MSTPEQHAAAPLPAAEVIATLPPDGGPEFNRLIFETSPYLRQHARNPVDWYPWGEEAFQKARAENKPVFLSVGYSSCHWCHVMAHESFEDPETAAIMNDLFVNIKVDREERPDIDDIYMKAVQAIVGRGGWPMSVFLLPDARPYYGGTYYPREDGRHGPGFKTILRNLADAYHNRHDEVVEQADRIVAAIEQQTGGARLEAVGPLARNLVDVALEQVLGTFDRDHGGSVGAPKFPPHISLALALYEYERAPTDRLKLFITKTLDGMMLGGIHDHIGGGFHRYSTDAVWLLPHFEKMLYDNGQLAHAYVSAYRLLADKHYKAVAEDICDWAIREMQDEAGGFYSALDADSEGEEGKFYVWACGEIMDVLGEDDGAVFCRLYNVKPDGNFHDEATRRPTGLNIPHLTRPLDELADTPGMPSSELEARMAAARLKLRAVRDKRVWPGLDDKVLTSWNGLMIAGLAEAGHVLGRPDYIEAAERAARFVLDTMRSDGRLLRTYSHGRAKLNGYLEDYAFLGLGLLELYDATGNAEWLEETRNLVEVLDGHYWDEVNGGYYFTSDDHEDLLTRQKDALDGATPSGNGIASQVLVRLAGATEEPAYAQRARRTFETYLGWMQRAPRATESMILAVAEYYDRGLAPRQAEAPAEDAAAAPAAQPDATWESAQVTASAFASRVILQAGMRFDVAVRLDIAEGWHLNSHAPLQEYLIPTEALLNGDPKLRAGDVTYPEGKTVTLGFSDEPLSVYEGTVWLIAPVTVGRDATTGPATVRIELTIQPCDNNQCLAPTTAQLAIPVTVIGKGAVGEPRHQDVFSSL